MNGDVTVRDVMTRDYVGVNEGDTVSGVAELLAEAPADGAVVLRGTEPVGLLDSRAIVAIVAAGSDPEEITVGSAMGDPPATVEAGAPLSGAISTLIGIDARHLLVVDGAEIVGLLSVDDVVAAQSTFPEEIEREAPVAAGVDEGPVDDRYSTQSVCEACGSLAGSLANVNGQLLCADCREL